MSSLCRHEENNGWCKKKGQRDCCALSCCQEPEDNCTECGKPMTTGDPFYAKVCYVCKAKAEQLQELSTEGDQS